MISPRQWFAGSLRNRFFTVLTLLTASLLLLQGLLLMRTTSATLEKMVRSETATTLRLVRQNLSSSIREAAYVPKDLETDPRFLTLMGAPGRNNRALTELLLRYISRRPRLLSITLFPGEEGICSTTFTFDIDEGRIRQSPWYLRAREGGGSQLIYMDVKDYAAVNNEQLRRSKTQCISMVRALYDRDGRYLGVLAASLDYFSIFQNIIRDIPLREGRRILLFNRKGELLFPAAAANADGLAREILPALEGGAWEGNLEDREFWYAYSTSPDGIILAEQIRKKELLKPVEQNRRLFFLSLGGSLLAALSAGSYLSGRITSPIKRLEEEMLQFEEKQYSLAVPQSRSDEVGALERSFNLMIRRMEEYQNQLLENREERRKAELTALQAQIRPHFLYNTLDSIKWMAMIQGGESIVRMIDALTGLLRNSINREEERIPLERELENIRRFTAIHNIRYEDRFSLEIELEEECAGRKLPKLLLQPLVENALFHAFGEEGGRIGIRVRREGAFLVCRIRDDGRGFPEAVLAGTPTERPCEGPGNGISLDNVRDRLRLYYGARAELALSNPPGGGACCLIRMPLEEEG